MPAGGHYATAQTVTITGASGATLRYTTDGTDPTTSSTSITSGNTLSVVEVPGAEGARVGLRTDRERRPARRFSRDRHGGRRAACAASGSPPRACCGAGACNSDGGLGDGTSTTRPTPVQYYDRDRGDLEQPHAHARREEPTASLWDGGAIRRTGDASAGRVVHQRGRGRGRHHRIRWCSSRTARCGRLVTTTRARSGMGRRRNRTSPVQVIGLTGIIAIAAGRDASYALQTDGAGGGLVWAWGENQYGELGDGSTMSRSTPTRVTGLGSVIADRGQRAWRRSPSGPTATSTRGGRNDTGQLGIGTTPMQTVRAARVRRSPASARWATGASHVIAVDTTARAWGWGAGAATWAWVRDSRAMAIPERSDLVGALSVSGGDDHTLGRHAGRLRPERSARTATPLGTGGTAFSYVPVDGVRPVAGRQHLADR